VGKGKRFYKRDKIPKELWRERGGGRIPSGGKRGEENPSHLPRSGGVGKYSTLDPGSEKKAGSLFSI